MPEIYMLKRLSMKPFMNTLFIIFGGWGGGSKKTNYISYIMVERHLNMYMYNRYVCVIVLSKDNFLNMCVFFLFKVGQQAKYKAMNSFRENTKEKNMLN